MTTLGEIGLVISAKCSVEISLDQVLTGYSTDSRTVKPGQLFFAIVGENFDGHDFAQKALANGAMAVVADREISGPHLLVADTLVAYGEAAANHLAALSAKVIGVTGSSGKTSTKDLIAQLLETVGPTVAPPGSFNNEIGLPATVLSATAETEFLVLEMGMRGIGHIQYLCEVASPDIAVITNIGSAHQELLGSAEAVRQAKSEILTGLKSGGCAVLFADDPAVASLAELVDRSVTFGESRNADFQISDLVLDELARPSFDLAYAGQRVRVKLPLSGEHQALNAAAAVAAATMAGGEFTQLCARLESVTSLSRWRMEVTERPDGVTIVNDAYNANPESMRAGLKALKAMANGRRTWAVLGEMRELGPDSVSAHDEIGRLCVRLDISKLLAIGTAGKIMQIGAREEGSWADEAEWVPTIEAAIVRLQQALQPGDLVLLKASRAIGLERVAEALLEADSGENLAP